jgi:hypothetical protein
MKLPVPDMTSLGITPSKALLDAPRGGSGQIMGPHGPPRSEQQQRQMRQPSLMPGKNPDAAGLVKNSQRQSQQINNLVTRRIDGGVAPLSASAVRQHQPTRSDNDQRLQNTGGGPRRNAQASGHLDNPGFTPNISGALLTRRPRHFNPAAQHATSSGPERLDILHHYRQSSAANPIVLDDEDDVVTTKQPNGADLIAAIGEVRGPNEGNVPLARPRVPIQARKQSGSAVRYGPSHSNRLHSVHQVNHRQPSASTPAIQTSKKHTPTIQDTDDALGIGDNTLANVIAQLQNELQGLRERGKFMEEEMSIKTGLLVEERNRTQTLETQIQEDRKANLEVIQIFKNVKQELVDKLVLVQKDLVNRIEDKKDMKAVGSVQPTT